MGENMKFTLAFGVYNKAPILEALLTSWFSTLSGGYSYEAVVVCDACVDGSQEIALKTLAEFDGTLSRHAVLETPDVYEIAVNNRALDWAADDSDLIVFIQDDNHIFDPAWDAWIVDARGTVEKPGAVALLAGGYFLKNGFSYRRVESQRPHKGEHFDKHMIPADAYPPGIYSVDFITRPFAVSTPLLRGLGGLGGPGWDVICWDDTDLSVKLLRRGYTNLYVSLDVLNTSMGLRTMPDKMREGFDNNKAHFLAAHQDWLASRKGHSYRFLEPLVWATSWSDV
jgi:glycosyltransferase involved in cell wall biosynthesis